MAEKTKKSADSRGKKPVKKDKKPSLFARLKKWFVNIITELKRVMWPDWKKLRQSTLTVLMIIGLSVIIILVFDTAINFIMRTTGIYSTKSSTETEPTETEPAGTDKATARHQAAPSMPVYLSGQGVRITFEG